jgi:hypothetical protein
MSNKFTEGFMNVNVILTFETYGDPSIDSQDIFDIEIKVRSTDTKVVGFLNEEFFPEIVSFCEQHDRSPKDLIKISTCAHWSVYEEITGHKPLYQYGHSCKWFFGNGRTDLDAWELDLIDIFEFGTNVDMSWVKCPEQQVEI